MSTQTIIDFDEIEEDNEQKDSIQIKSIPIDNFDSENRDVNNNEINHQQDDLNPQNEDKMTNLNNTENFSSCEFVAGKNT